MSLRPVRVYATAFLIVFVLKCRNTMGTNSKKGECMHKNENVFWAIHAFTSVVHLMSTHGSKRPDLLYDIYVVYIAQKTFSFMYDTTMSLYNNININININVCTVCLYLCSHAWVKLCMFILAAWAYVVALLWHVVVSWLATVDSKYFELGR